MKRPQGPVLGVPIWPHDLSVEEIQFDGSKARAQITADLLRPYTRLTSLRFPHFRVTPETLLEILKLKNIVSLSFEMSTRPPPYNLLWQHGSHLTALDLRLWYQSSVLELSPANMTAMITSLPKLKRLALTFSARDSTGISTLLSSSTITSLELTHVPASDELFADLMTMPALRSLRISLESRAISAATIAALSKWQLDSFFLSAASGKLPGPEIFTALAANTSLRMLGFEPNDVVCTSLASSSCILRAEALGQQALLNNHTLIRLFVRDPDPVVAAHIEQNYLRHTQWIRHDFVTTLIDLASQRFIPMSPWSRLPLDVLRLIFYALQTPGKTHEQIIGLVEFVWSNVEVIKTHIQTTKHGVKVKEAVVKPRSRFRWESAAPAGSTAGASTATSGGATQGAQQQPTQQEQCRIQ